MTLRPTIPDKPSGLGISTADKKDVWWKYQRETTQEIVEAFTRKRFVFLNAPTGSGKTIISTAVQRALGITSVNLTHTKALQSQYTKTLPWATIVTGRNNYPCRLPKDELLIGDSNLNADEAPCAHGERCQYQRGGCGYYDMLHEAAENPQTVINYAYGCRIFQLPNMRRLDYADRNPFHRELLVCDEGHLAEDAVVGVAQVRIYPHRWGEIGAVLPPYSEKVGAWVNWAEVVRPVIAEQVAKARATAQETRNTKDWKEFSRLNAMLRSAEEVRRIRDHQAWLIGEEKNSYILRPIWGNTVAERILWGKFPRVLIMSATLGDTGILAQKLGIPMVEVHSIDVPSVFPPENRPVYYWPVVKLNHRSGDEDYERLAKAVDYIANQPALKDKKGIVHTGSYKVADQLYKRLAKVDFAQRYMSHGTPLSEEVIARFRDSEKPYVLLSPGATTGIDIPYVVGWQIIAKVPFSNLGDRIVRARREYVAPDGTAFGKKSYDSDAMQTIIQAAGRAVRAPDDRGVSYILDGNYAMLQARTHQPKFYKEAFHWPKS